MYDCCFLPAVCAASDKVQLLGQAFQKIQTATGIQVHLPLPLATTRTGAAGATVPFSAKRVRMTTSK